MPKQITQAELRTVLEHYNNANRTAAEISPAEVLPAWLKETPSGLDYILEAREFQHTEMVQDVRLTESEYIAAKQLVAKMRGYAVTEEAHA